MALDTADNRRVEIFVNVQNLQWSWPWEICGDYAGSPGAIQAGPAPCGPPRRIELPSGWGAVRHDSATPVGDPPQEDSSARVRASAFIPLDRCKLHWQPASTPQENRAGHAPEEIAHITTSIDFCTTCAIARLGLFFFDPPCHRALEVNLSTNRLRPTTDARNLRAKLLVAARGVSWSTPVLIRLHSPSTRDR